MVVDGLKVITSHIPLRSEDIQCGVAEFNAVIKGRNEVRLNISFLRVEIKPRTCRIYGRALDLTLEDLPQLVF